MVAETPRFEIGEAFGAAWRDFTANIGPLVVYALAVLLVDFALNRVIGGATGFPERLTADLVSFVVTQLITIGWLRVALDALDGRAVTFDRIRESFGVFVPYAVAALVFSILFAIGIVLLIVPGIIVAVTFGFYGWVLVDGRKNDAFEALRFSAEITRGERMHLFGLGVVIVVLNIVGALLFLVGLLVTAPLSLIAVAHVYRALVRAHDGRAALAAE